MVAPLIGAGIRAAGAAARLLLLKMGKVKTAKPFYGRASNEPMELQCVARQKDVWSDVSNQQHSVL
jgi:hypothetical protein